MNVWGAAVFAIAVFGLSLWIVVPGPVPAVFILSVGGTELWPLLALFDCLAFVVAVRSRPSPVRPLAVTLASGALICTLFPPAAYLLRGPHVPLGAFFFRYPAAGTANGGVPVVLAIYGGAWQRGSPRTDSRLNAVIASWGYRVIALDYPHAPAARWPAQRTAILRQIDAVHARRIVLLGHSSGAQLAMIAAALRPHRIDGVITYESPVDLRLGYEHPSHPDIINARKIMGDLCGGTPAQRPSCYRSASPRYAVHAGMPPVLMLAAGRDHVVDLGFERLLRDKLRSAGVNVTYVELPWADHAFETVPYGFHNLIALWFVHRFLAERRKSGYGSEGP